MILRALLLSVCVASAASVSFRVEIAPLLQRRCATCHSADNIKGRYQLDTFARLQKAGQSELPALVPGKPKESEIYNLLLEASPEDRMPQKADALPAQEIALIERWIAEGARYDGGAMDRSLVELNRATMLRPAPARYARPFPITALAFSPDGAQLAVSGYYEVTIWNVADGSLVTRLSGLPERITSLAWNGAHIAVAGGSPMQWGTIALVDVANLAPPEFLCDLTETALSVAFSPNGAQLAAGCGDRTVRLFDAANGRARKVLRPHADWVQAVAFSPDSKHVLTASRDRTARVLDATTGEVSASYTGHDTSLLGAAFSLDGIAAWTLARGGALHRWDFAKVARNGEIKGAEFVQFVASSGGIVTGSTDRKLRLWGVDRQVKVTWDAAGETVQALALNRDGTRLACGSVDGTVAIYALPEGKLVRTFVAQPR